MAEPSWLVAQWDGVVTSVRILSCAGWNISKDIDALQLWPSVTVTVCSVAERLVANESTEALPLQVYEYAGVPPVASTLAYPLVPPKQVTESVESVSMRSWVGCPR
jgi:hypothetical protein